MVVAKQIVSFGKRGRGQGRDDGRRRTRTAPREEGEEEDVLSPPNSVLLVVYERGGGGAAGWIAAVYSTIVRDVWYLVEGWVSD